MNLHDMIQNVLQEARAGAEALQSETDDVTKTAGVSAGEETIDSDLVEKTAAGIEWLISQFTPDPSIEVRRRLSVVKEAMTHPTGGGEKFSVTQAKDGKQSYETGQSNKQPKEKGFQKADGGAKNSVGDNDGEMKKRLGQTQPQLKTAQRELLKEQILAKMSGLGKEALSDPEGISAAGEGPSAKGKGADFVSSADKVINLTKGKAKSLVKSDLAKLLEANALSKKDDPVLHNVWRNTSKAGVKIAAAEKIKTRIQAAREGKSDEN